MRRLYRTVVQLEEAKRFILDGDVARLRLALILLDNAVEAIMSRVIDDKFGRARMYAQMLGNFPAGALDVESETLKRKIAAEVIPERRQKKVERDFNEKLALLSENCRDLPPPTARTLRHLHLYRNETQHHDRIRVGSIRPAVLVLFDIAADLLVSLQPRMTTWASDEDYGWLRKYGFSDTFPLGRDDLRARIAAELRSDLPLGVVGIRKALVGHLTDRLDAMDEQLDFVASNWTTGPDPSGTLKAIQFWHLHKPGCRLEGPELQAFIPAHNLDSFTQWRTAVDKLNFMEDRLALFGRFATIENEFQPLEAMIDDMAAAIDAGIQAEIDRIRGK